MSPLRVSEKTLELNICAEVLHAIRQIPGCSRAFWIGMKQNQEARLGIDELIQNVPTGMHLTLQFKAPRSEPRDKVPYMFTINDRQNNNLLRLAGYRPHAVYYIFPHYNSFTKMRVDSPNLLRDAWLLKVNDLKGLPTSTNKQGTHVVRTNPPIAILRSEPIETRISSAVETIGGILRGGLFPFESILISHTTLKEWLGYLISEAEGNKFVVGQGLRGFSTFCIN
jgi:hypothetical protein